jgi:ATP-dependent RNA helicase DDX56/DBP9
MSFLLDEEKSWMQRDFGLDRRLIKALSKLGFIYPTLVQARCIPIALQGKDVLVRARTGSGKTVAFSLPVLQKILSQKDSNSQQQSTKCIILAPTKELIKQIETHITDLIYYCRDDISVCSLIDDNIKVQLYRLQTKPDIVVSTPSRLVQHIKAGNIDLSSCQTLVIDEADLVLSFGYTEDVHLITSKMPKLFQGILMSATLSAELDKFKRVLLHNPAVMKLEEPEGVGHLLQFYLETSEMDKYLIVYVFIKLGLLQVIIIIIIISVIYIIIIIIIILLLKTMKFTVYDKNIFLLDDYMFF